ncbi:putative Alkaline phosphatase [Streptomyces misionensis JCM 4497]
MRCLTSRSRIRLPQHYVRRGTAHAHSCHRGRRLRRPGPLRPRPARGPRRRPGAGARGELREQGRPHRPPGPFVLRRRRLGHAVPAERHLLQREGEQRQEHRRRHHQRGQGAGVLHADARHGRQDPREGLLRGRRAVPRDLLRGLDLVLRQHQRVLHGLLRDRRQLQGHRVHRPGRAAQRGRRQLEGRRLRGRLQRPEPLRPGPGQGRRGREGPDQLLQAPALLQADGQRQPGAGEEGQDHHRRGQAVPRQLGRRQVPRLHRAAGQAAVPQEELQHLHHPEDHQDGLHGQPEDDDQGHGRRLLPVLLRGHLDHPGGQRRG